MSISYVTAGNPTKAADINAIIPNVVVKTTSHTITDTGGIETYAVSSTGGNITITLPTLSDNQNRILHIQKVDSSTNSVTIDGEGTETINGNLTYKIEYQKSGISIQATTSGWKIKSAVGNIGPICLIPEDQRPGSYILSGGNSTAFADVDFGAYVPTPVNALLITFLHYWTGNGSADSQTLKIRANGSTETATQDTIENITGYTNLGAGTVLQTAGQCIVACDTGGVIEYAVGSTSSSIFMTLRGYCKL